MRFRAKVALGGEGLISKLIDGSLGPDAVIVTLAVDSGFKYMSVAPYAALQ